MHVYGKQVNSMKKKNCMSQIFGWGVKMFVFERDL